METIIPEPNGKDASEYKGRFGSFEDTIKIVPIVDNDLIVGELIAELTLRIRPEPVIEI